MSVSNGTTLTSYTIGSKRDVTWCLEQGWKSGRRHVDVNISCRKSKIQKVLAVLEAEAEAQGAEVVRHSAGIDPRTVIVRFPIKGPTEGEGPSAGDREPRRPHPPTSSDSIAINRQAE